MSKQRFAAAMTSLAEYYGKELSSGVLALYWQGLSQFSIDEIESAIGLHLQSPDSGQWMPKIADIIRMIEGTTADAATIAWAKVMRAVGSVGQYQSLAFDDALIHAVIDDMGGWAKICQTEEKEIPFSQSRFEKAYRAYRVRRETPVYPKYLCGVSETQNSAAGHRSDPPLLVGNKSLAQSVLNGGSNAPRLPIHIWETDIGSSPIRLLVNS